MIDSGRLRRRLVLAAFAGAALLLTAGLVVLWVAAPRFYRHGETRDSQTSAAATTRAGILAVGAASLAALAAVANLSETRRANLAAYEQEREAQVTDRYTKAIGQLGEASQVSVRLGGIYALERIAADSAKDHRSVVEVLSAFVRENSRKEDRPAPENDSVVTGGHSATRPSTDVQAALTVLGRLPVRPGVPRADLRGAGLSGAELQRAELSWAELRGVDLRRSELGGATLVGAWLGEANLANAWLPKADLSAAWLRGANLSGANLSQAACYDARLEGANLTGTLLSEAVGLTGAQLLGAIGDATTQLPPNVSRPPGW